MKNNRLVLVLALMLSVNSFATGSWMTSLEDAKKMALATDKLILVDFWAIWCGPCNKMDSESWSQDDVKLLMDSYIPVKIDIDSNKNLAQQYGVQGIPYIFILDGNGKVLYKQMSYKSKNDVIKMLKKYALNTQFLRQDLINYHNQQNFVTSFRLASKFQDYSLYVSDKNVKYDILQLSSNYFNDSEKFLKNTEMTNKETFIQKIELFEIQSYLITQNASKAIRKIEKIESSSIHELNQGFYNFLCYTAYNMDQDAENAKLWKDKVSEFDLKKSELFTATVGN